MTECTAHSFVQNTGSAEAGWAVLLAGGFLEKVSIWPHLEDRALGFRRGSISVNEMPQGAKGRMGLLLS